MRCKRDTVGIQLLGEPGREESTTSKIGTRFEELSGDARYLDYEAVADPVGAGRIPAVPIARFGRWRYCAAATGVIELDLSPQLGLMASGPATGPGLLASFVRIRASEDVFASPNATSQLYYVMEGRGFTAADGHLVRWEAGDFLTLPTTQLAVHAAEVDSTLFWVHDEPMLRHLGVTASEPRFRPTKFPRAHIDAALEALLRRTVDDHVPDPERRTILLATATQEQPASVSPVLRAMVGVLAPGDVWHPHRHQSTGLVLVADAAPGCYTLLGATLSPDGRIVDPVRIDWEPGGAFVTPPGMWRTHVNESPHAARVVPVEDGGLQAHLRTLEPRSRRVGPHGA